MTTTPLTEQRLDEITARTDATRSGPWTLSDDLEGDGYPGHLWVVRTPDSGPDEPDDQAVVISIGDRALGEFIAHAREDMPTLLAEVHRLSAALTEMTHCRDNALRALYRDDVDTDIDLEETIAAPFYGPGWDWDASDLKPVVREAAAAIRPAFGKLTQERDRLRTDAAAELLPVWEAVYEPGNVSDYLIGYANSEAAATGAAEAWMRSQSEVTGRLEWVPWGDATPMPDGYDRWFELAQRHADGVDTGPGITVRRRTEAAQEGHRGEVDPSACRWCGIPEREHMQRWKKPVGWHKWEQPTGEQVKERMRARRAARSTGRLLDCGWCYEEQGEEVHPHPECPIGAVVSVGNPTSAPTPAPLGTSHSPAGDRDGETGTEGAAGPLSDSALALVGASPNTLLRHTEHYLSVSHHTRHDNLAANYGCAGCELRDAIRARQAATAEEATR